MSSTNQHKDLFTLSRDAGLWNSLYDAPTKVYHHHMAQRRNYAREYTARNFERSARVLDLGCGAGVLTELLIEDGFRPAAADVSHDMLALARERLKRFPPGGYRIVHAGVEDLPFEDGEFDIVLCLGVFGYIEDVDGAVAEIRRVLKPGGVFFMSVRNRTNELLSDPYLMADWLLRKIAVSLGLRRIKRLLTASGPAPHESGDPRAFHIAIYDSPRNVIRGVSRSGFVLDLFDGFGFGPLSLFRKKLLSVATSIKLSDFLNRFFRKTRLSPLTARVADVSIYVFRKAGA
jgi:ubiquinone/menaquinone biosynthesis C-methylase UbiE